MALASAQVIDAVAALLRSVPAWAAKVHTSRTWPLADADLPAWRVQAEEEDVEPMSIHYPMRQQHELQLHCHGYARATADLDDTLHALAETALGTVFANQASTTLAPLGVAMVLQRIERAMVTEGEAAMGRITLALRVRFATFSNAPSTLA